MLGLPPWLVDFYLDAFGIAVATVANLVAVDSVILVLVIQR